MALKLDHPTTEQLCAFTLGRLSQEEATEIESHISRCDPCCETLLNLSGEDTFIDLLKEAQQTPDEGTVDLSLNSPFTNDRTHASQAVPSELAEHPRYRMEGLIGHGGMGDVYRAEHRLMQRSVALKVINRRLMRKPEAVGRFHREVRAAARLHHPNIVTAFDAEQAGDTHFLAMEYIEGTELSEIVDRDGPLPVEVACDYARQAALGLAHAHQMGMVHRDVKPQNLMVTPAGKVKILDFGLANFVSETIGEVAAENEDSDDGPTCVAQLTQLGTMMGTPDYIAPEQATDARRADIRSDIYSLGCTLFYLLTGRPPFGGETVRDKIEAHAYMQPESLSAIREEIPSKLQEVVEKMMAKDAAERYQNPNEVAKVLQEIRDQLRELAQLAQPASSGSGSRSGRRLWTLAGSIFFMATIVLVTDRGRLHIESEVDDVKVVVKQDGQETKVIDLSTGSQITWLPTGKYELELVGGHNDVVIDKQGFQLKRLSNVVVRARWDSSERSILHSFQPPKPTITRDNVEVVGDSWKLVADEPRTFRLFEASLPPLKKQPLFYRAKLKSEDVENKAYLEMWVRFPGSGEFFSKGLLHALSGTNDWAEYEVPFQVSGDTLPDQVKLNLTIEGKGTVWVKNVEVIGNMKSQPTENQASTELQDHSSAGNSRTDSSQFAAGLSVRAFEKKNGLLKEQGFRPNDVSICLVDGVVRVSAIWTAFTGPSHDVQVFVDQSKQESQANFDKLTKQGYRKTLRAGHVLNGEPRTVSVFEKIDGPRWFSRGYLAQADFQRLFDMESANGFRLTDFSVLPISGEVHVASLWVEDKSRKWQARLGLPVSTFKRLAEQMAKEGYAIDRICSSVQKGKTHYASIWIEQDKPARKHQLDLTEEELQRRNKQLSQQGYRLVQLSPFSSGKSVRYAAIWEASISQENSSSEATPK